MITPKLSRRKQELATWPNSPQIGQVVSRNSLKTEFWLTTTSQSLKLIHYQIHASIAHQFGSIAGNYVDEAYGIESMFPMDNEKS